jgi:hypothetical protein
VTAPSIAFPANVVLIADRALASLREPLTFQRIRIRGRLEPHKAESTSYPRNALIRTQPYRQTAFGHFAAQTVLNCLQ